MNFLFSPSIFSFLSLRFASSQWGDVCDVINNNEFFYLLPLFSLSSHQDSPHPTTNRSFPPIYFSFSCALYSFDFFSFPFIIFGFIWLLYQTQSLLSWLLIFYIIFIIIFFSFIPHHFIFMSNLNPILSFVFFSFPSSQIVFFPFRHSTLNWLKIKLHNLHNIFWWYDPSLMTRTTYMKC